MTTRNAMLSLFGAAVMPVLLQAQSPGVELSVSNTLGLPRKAETVELPLIKLRRLMPGLRGDSLAVFLDGQLMRSQIVEGDVPGGGELLLFQSDFDPHQTRTFLIRQGAVPRAFPALTDARFVLPRQDLAWENDRIAFRMYGSVLAGNVNNGIDVWTKRVRSLVVGKWYRLSEQSPPGHDYYHEDHGEGGDFFEVGSSLGCGGAAIVDGERLVQSGLFTGHSVLATGPIRAIFELVYDSGRVRGRPYRVVQRISLDAGGNMNRVQVTYTGVADTFLVASGLVQRAGVTASSNAENGWISLWGPTDGDPVNGSLGTGVVMPLASFRGARKVGEHLLILGAARKDTPLVYYAGAGWTRGGDFASGAEWDAYIDAFARRLRAPLKILIRAAR